MRKSAQRRKKDRKALMEHRMKGKLALLFTIIVLALIGVNIRLAYINKTNGEKYTKKSAGPAGHCQYASALQKG